MKLAAQDFAPGIPTRITYPIPQVLDSENWDYVVQKHDAEVAGKHLDFRLSDGKHGHSWAIRKTFPEPGEQVLAVQQFTHRPDYLKFEGKIHKGYGKGDVKIQKGGTAQVLSADNNKIKFVMPDTKYPEEFMLVRMKDKKWLLQNTTPTKKSRPDIPLEKEEFKTIDEEELLEKYLGEDYELQPKIDGAHILLDIEKRPRIFSYRPSKVTEKLIQHTYKVPELNVIMSDKIRGTLARGELYGVNEEGKTIALHTLSGILNSSTTKALETLKNHGYKLRIKLFDLERYKGKDVKDKPYKERRELLLKLKELLPENVEIMPSVRSAGAKQELLDKIKKGLVPETKEGIIIWAREETGPPKKMKFRDDHDVWITEVLPGEGRLTNTLGRLGYALEPGGPTVGYVGTGFTDEERSEIWKNHKKYLGRSATLYGEEKLPSGALRAPSFKVFHMEKNL